MQESQLNCFRCPTVDFRNTLHFSYRVQSSFSASDVLQRLKPIVSAQQVCPKPVGFTRFLGRANLVCPCVIGQKWDKRADFGLFHPRQLCLYEGGEEGGEHIKLDLKCCVSDAFQATSVLVSVVFYWSERYVKPVNEEQLLWWLSLRAEKAV